MWKLNFKIEPVATVATTATDHSFSDNKAESVATVAVVAGGGVLKKVPSPPIPKSVYACLEYLRRTKFERPLTPKLEAWLASDQSIEAYQRTVELLYRPLQVKEDDQGGYLHER